VIRNILFRTLTTLSVLTIFSAISAIAQPTLTLSSIIVEAEDTFQLELTLNTDGKSVSAVSTDITFDASVIQIISTDIGPAANSAGKMVIDNEVETGTYRVGILSLMNADVIGNGIVGYINGTVASSASDQIVTLSQNASGSDPNGLEITVSGLNASISIGGDGDSLPVKVTPTSPLGTTEDTTPTFLWNEDVNATWYMLFISDSSKETVHAQWYKASEVCSNGSCSTILESKLSNNSYEWWLMGWNGNGYGDWNDGMTFIVQGSDSPPSKVAHTSPGGQLDNSTPTYTWVANPNATWYKLWIGYPNGDRMFAQWYDAANICSDGNCSVAPESDLSGGDYEWYIKSWNNYGRIWSDGMSFSVAE